MERVVQFRVPKTALSYSMKLVYDERTRLLQSFERQEIRRNDRSVEFHMLNGVERERFLEHFRDKVTVLPITAQNN